jgi:hypothetical protein
MMMATLIASCCNAGLGSHTCHLSLQIGWKKRKDHLERYLSTMWHLILEVQTVHTEGPSVMDGSWKTDGWMDRWIDGGQIWIALGSNSGVSNKHMMSVSVSHLIWKEEIMRSKREKYQNQNGRLNKHIILIKK